MYNCAAGKDRTGVVTAIILMLCDVREEDIVYNLRANTRDFSHEIQPFLHMHFTNYYNIS